MLVGYARVSRLDQNLAVQIHHLTEAGCERIFEDHGESGATLDRPSITEMLGFIRPDDVVIVTKLDRLSRSLNQMLTLVERISEIGANLISLAERAIDTTSPAGRLTFQLFAVVAEFERERLRERTMEGLDRAKAAGIHLGRPKKLSTVQITALVGMRKAGSSWTELARIFAVSRSTARKCVSDSQV